MTEHFTRIFPMLAAVLAFCGALGLIVWFSVDFVQRHKPSWVVLTALWLFLIVFFIFAVTALTWIATLEPSR